MRPPRGFTLVELMIVVLIIAILLGIAIPNFLAARSTGSRNTCIANMRQIDDAKQQWAMDNRADSGTSVQMSDLTGSAGYITGPVSGPSCPTGGSYTVNVVGANPTCSLSGAPYKHLLP